MSQTRSFNSIIFDLDGTLTDPREGFGSSISFALTSLGIEAPPALALRRFIGPPIHDTFQRLLGTDDPVLVEEAVGLYRQWLGGEGIRGNIAYPGVVKMLTGLQEARKTLFIATAKPVEFAVPILEHCGLRGFFREVYGSRLGQANTPKGELIYTILNDYDISTDNITMVGDRSHDILGARENAVYSIGVTYGYGSAAELRAAGADVLCDIPGHVTMVLSS